jgi:voltage-gated potassium channel
LFFKSANLQRLIQWAETFWPWLPLAAISVLSGFLNIMNGLKYQPLLLSKAKQLALVTEPLAFLGSGAQIVLGAGLVLIGIGFLWRLAAAWAFAVLLLLITIGVNLAQKKWDASLYLPCFMLLALMIYRRHFTRQTLFAHFLFSLISILAIFAYGVLGTFILGQSFRPPVNDLASAFYFAVITLATVGYGDITPVTSEARLFVVSFILVGLSIFATVFVSALGPTISSEIDRIFYPKRKKMKPKNHVILAGEGAIARNTARELMDRGIGFVHIISQNAAALVPEKQLVRGNPSGPPGHRGSRR